MINKKIKDRLEKVKNEMLVTESLVVTPSISQQEKELMLMNLASEQTTLLNWVLLQMEQESGSSDDMRSKEEVKNEIKKCHQELSDYAHSGSETGEMFSIAKIKQLKWVLNEQEEEE